MTAPLSSTSKQATTDVAVELSHSQPPPPLPFELQGIITPDTWETRVHAIVAVTSRYSRPTFERIYLMFGILVTLVISVAAYYFSLRELENTGNNSDANVWYARFISLGVTIATWVVLFFPVTLWKYMGKVRIKKILARWSQDDIRTIPPYAAGPEWRLTPPGLFRDAIILAVTVPVKPRKSNFQPDANLPPYIGPASEPLPPYRYLKMNHWSKDISGGTRYGDIPIYSDSKNIF
ncbi:hypothetical protein F5I97DRAFT_746970 [Phlebopus sp. FC_14]|nr:hypothetical protein F5I97DRAFT_746970 [Phlebopus sp. FC_14]